jgi:hypothetical protein
MTNGDYIRQMMSDEYIARGFCGLVYPFDGDCDVCPLYDNPKCGSFEERLKWVKAEYAGEEEADLEVEYSDFCDEKAEQLSELEEIRDILSDLVKRIEKMEDELS